MAKKDINYIETDLHLLSKYQSAFDVILQDLRNFYSQKHINVLIIIYGYHKGQFFKKKIESDDFVYKMQSMGYFLYRSAKFEKTDDRKYKKLGRTAFIVENELKPSHIRVPMSWISAIETKQQFQAYDNVKKAQYKIINQMKKENEDLRKEKQSLENKIIKLKKESENQIDSVNKELKSLKLEFSSKWATISQKNKELKQKIQRYKKICQKLINNQPYLENLEQFSNAFVKMDSNYEKIIKMLRLDIQTNHDFSSLLHKILLSKPEQCKISEETNQEVQIKSNIAEDIEKINKKAEEEKKVISKSNEGKKEWKCPICEKEFRKKHSLQDHQEKKNHFIETSLNLERSFNCQSCDRSFNSQSALEQHQKARKHGSGKNVKCPYCHKSFRLPEDLNQHIEAKHKLILKRSTLKQDQTWDKFTEVLIESNPRENKKSTIEDLEKRYDLAKIDSRFLIIHEMVDAATTIDELHYVIKNDLAKFEIPIKMASQMSQLINLVKNKKKQLTLREVKQRIKENIEEIQHMMEKKIINGV
ncbi:MAG: C2H2-type zinc finger protein [Candidatus Lokiarchaeota archaeon]|nr:C2H2-type zinc finger protein [Candidatus Harpocratesius repetitus]